LLPSARIRARICLANGSRTSSYALDAGTKSLKTLKMSRMSDRPLAIMDLKASWDAGRQDRAARMYRTECPSCEFFHYNYFAPATKTPDKLFWCDLMDGNPPRRCKIKDKDSAMLAQIKYIPKRKKIQTQRTGSPSNPPGIPDSEPQTTQQDLPRQPQDNQTNHRYSTNALPHLRTPKSASIRSSSNRSRRSQSDDVDLPPMPQG
jgi:hypothetical protein